MNDQALCFKARQKIAGMSCKCILKEQGLNLYLGASAGFSIKPSQCWNLKKYINKKVSGEKKKNNVENVFLFPTKLKIGVTN